MADLSAELARLKVSLELFQKSFEKMEGIAEDLAATKALQKQFRRSYDRNVEKIFEKLDELETQLNEGSVVTQGIKCNIDNVKDDIARLYKEHADKSERAWDVGKIIIYAAIALASSGIGALITWYFKSKMGG